MNRLTAIANIPSDLHNILFLNGRMQPPTKGHIFLLRQMLQLDSCVVLGLGLSPMDQLDQISQIAAKLQVLVAREEIAKVANDLSLTGKSLLATLEAWLPQWAPDRAKLALGLQTRLMAYRQVVLKPLTEAVQREIWLNPFTLAQREQMIRQQLTDAENCQLVIHKQVGSQNAEAILSQMVDNQPIRNLLDTTNRAKVYMTAGEEYSSRATHRFNEQRKMEQLTIENDFAVKNGFDQVIVVPHNNREQFSGAKARTSIQSNNIDAVASVMGSQELAKQAIEWFRAVETWSATKERPKELTFADAHKKKLSV